MILTAAAFADWRWAGPTVVAPVPTGVAATALEGKVAEPGPAWPGPTPRLIIF